MRNVIFIKNAKPGNASISRGGMNAPSQVDIDIAFNRKQGTDNGKRALPPA
jgi:hypothetical protein